MTRYTRSPYEILGISADATRKDIKKRYRLLAKRFHPDCASGDPEAEAKFKEIQWAYETLTVVAEKRLQIDQQDKRHDITALDTKMPIRSAGSFGR